MFRNVLSLMIHQLVNLWKKVNYKLHHTRMASLSKMAGDLIVKTKIELNRYLIEPFHLIIALCIITYFLLFY